MPACTCLNFCNGILGGGCNPDGSPKVPSVCGPILETARSTGLCSGGNNVACQTTHTTSVTTTGPGVCCAALSASGQTPVVGLRIAATDKLGHCIVCEVKSSTSKAHPGRLVFKRGKAQVPGSQVSCPSTSQGCCALTGG